MRKLEWLVVLMPVAIVGALYAGKCQKQKTVSFRESTVSNLEEEVVQTTSTISYSRYPPVGPAPITPPVVSPHLDQPSGESPLTSCIFKCEYDNGMGIYAESCIEDCFKKYNY